MKAMQGLIACCFAVLSAASLAQQYSAKILYL